MSKSSTNKPQPTEALPDYYQILGLTSGATAQAIKKAYYALALTLHPDKWPEQLRALNQRRALSHSHGQAAPLTADEEKVLDEANDKFKLLETAFRTLFDTEKRADYDAMYGGQQALIAGKKALQEGMPDEAFHHFSRIPTRSPSYQEAMYEWANFLLFCGEREAAAEYFKRAGEANLAEIAGQLTNHPDLSLTDARTLLHPESKDNPNQNATSQVPLINAHGIFPLQPTNASGNADQNQKEIKGLDEDDSSPEP